MHAPVRHDDLDELRRRNIAVPAVFQRGAWLTVRLGEAPGLGPSATQLLLWLPVADAADAIPSWADVEAVIGPGEAATSRTVPAAAAVLWDGDAAPEVTAGEPATVHGVEYPAGREAFGNVFWKHGWVLGTRGGLLVSLVNA